MLAYAIDNPAPSTIILITGDRDFAYALSILKLRRYQVVLVTLPNAHASLVYHACFTFDWFSDVVNRPDVPNSQLQHKAPTPDVSNEAWSPPCTVASDLSDEESDDGYPRKQAQRDIYPTYSAGAPSSPSKNSRNFNDRAHSPVPSKPQTSYPIGFQSILDEDQTTINAYLGRKFPANGDPRGTAQLLEAIVI